MTDTILVTGGAGFIGSHVARKLIENGFHVVVADNLLTGDSDNVPDGAEFVVIDLADEQQYSKLDVCQPKVVIHLAGQSSGEISFESPVNDLDINTKSTILLGEWAVKQGCRRFLYASSVSVYGDGQLPGGPMSESDRPLPKTFYACSKLASENYLKVFGDSFGMNTTAFRLFNVYGPGQNMSNMKQGMVSIYLAYILFRDALEVKGSFSRYRDFVYMTDVVDLLLQCIDDERSFGKVFNVGTGCKTTVKELVDMMLQIAGKENFPVRELTGTPGDAFGSLADMTYIRDVLGWESQISLEQGLKKMVAFYAPEIMHR